MTASDQDKVFQPQTLVDHLFRQMSGRMVATLTRLFGTERLDLAEDVAQEALLKALRLWPFQGIPKSPEAWLMRVAKNEAITALRREASLRRKLPALLQKMDTDSGSDFTLNDQELDDGQLRMMFLCCHPELTLESQIALTLKLVSGFGVPEIARAFLQSETTIAQRLVRAKRAHRESKAPLELPTSGDLSHRLSAVLAALYLLFNEGYFASVGEALISGDICAEAIRLCSDLTAHPQCDTPETHALLALMLLQASRLSTRINGEGDLLLLSEQDRSQWDRAAINAGLKHLELAAAGSELSKYHLQAGVAACHATAVAYQDTDWQTILFYYDSLVEIDPSPIIALNRIVALSETHGTEAGLKALEPLERLSELHRYVLLPATHAELLRRLGNYSKATVEYQKAMELTSNITEQRFLRRRYEECLSNQSEKSL